MTSGAAPQGGVDGWRVDVLGVGISAIDLDAAVERIGAWIEQGARQYVCVTGVHGVMECQRDGALRAIHNASGLTTPDGMPMVWAGRWVHAPQMARVYGPDLALAVLAEAVVRGWSSYFYGGGPGIATKFADAMAERFPGLPVAGTRTPPFGRAPEQDGLDVAAINASGADIVWVGLSTPKQERWMAAHRDELDAPVLVGVGAAFDLLSSTVPQAPRWVQRSGLEWAYRLAREPRRLWRRYLRNNPAFVLAILRRRPRLLPWPPVSQ